VLRDLDLGNAPLGLREDVAFRHFVDIYRHVRTRTYATGGVEPKAFEKTEFQHRHKELLEIIQAKGWNQCVVIYDEANKLANDIQIEQLVCHEEMLSEPGRVSVYAATPAMAESYYKTTSEHEVRLLPFDGAEVQRLLLSYWSRTAGHHGDLPVTADAGDAIWKLTEGRPYRVQLLAGASFTIANEHRASLVSRSHVESALDRLRKEKPAEFAS